MKKGLTFILGAFSGVVLTLVVIIAVLPQRMFVEQESKLGFDETVAAIEQSVKDNNWSMPHQYNLQATMSKHGFSVKPVKVFSLCKPEHAYEILKSDKERPLSAMMPCRVSVYEKDGKTYVSMMNSGFLSKFMGKTAKEVMGAASAENLQILQPILN
ncbi:DUF302 domain-containing protein [Maribellus mangrovi]|uniref:DUF302 domain-containing protein n=1 Tax=Maribellus mangrovi TaxID=3133146 RepID=UPI0030EEB46E